MLKRVLRKSALLLGVVLALCAFVLPSVAPAASWSPVGTSDGRIDTSNLGFSLPALNSGSSCDSTSIGITVDSATVATITSASFANCRGDIGNTIGCTQTAVGTNFPWRVTALTTTNIQIHGVDIDIYFETTPGTLNECSRTGIQLRLTGTASGVIFTPGPVGSRRFDFNGATGLVGHLPGVGTVPLVPHGSGLATGLLNVVL